MAVSSSASMPGLGEVEFENQQTPLLQHSSGEGATADAASPRRNRNRPGNPSKILYICAWVLIV